MASTPDISRLISKRDLDRIDRLEAEVDRLEDGVDRLEAELARLTVIAERIQTTIQGKTNARYPLMLVKEIGKEAEEGDH